MNKNKGFTLIELLIVMGILGVLLTMTIIAVNPAGQFQRASGLRYLQESKSLIDALFQCYVDNKGTFTGCYNKLSGGLPEAEVQCGSQGCLSDARTTDINYDTVSYNGVAKHAVLIGNRNIVGYYSVDLCPLVSKGYLSRLPCAPGSTGCSNTDNGHDCSAGTYYSYYYLYVNNHIMFICPSAGSAAQAIASLNVGISIAQNGMTCISKKF